MGREGIFLSRSLFIAYIGTILPPYLARAHAAILYLHESRPARAAQIIRRKLIQFEVPRAISQIWPRARARSLVLSSLDGSAAASADLFRGHFPQDGPEISREANFLLTYIPIYATRFAHPRERERAISPVKTQEHDTRGIPI